MKTYFLNLKINPTEIHFLNSIMESYGGMANVRTISAAQGLVQLWVMPDFLEEVQLIIKDISGSIGLVNMEWGEEMYAG